MNYWTTFALGAVFIATPAIAADPVRVLDGDTIAIDGTTYRIHGIDAPEAGQTCIRARGGTWPCGREAIDALTTLVSAWPVQCVGRGLDDYGRTLAVCHADGVDVGSELVSRGLAWSFRRYASDYNSVEDEARRHGLGIWQAETETAWDLRAKRWQAAQQEAPGGCPIKGNINRQGEHIYHAPWSPWYGRTVVNEKHGERWFCDEAEAMAAGWRAPYWGG